MALIKAITYNLCRNEKIWICFSSLMLSSPWSFLLPFSQRGQQKKCCLMVVVMMTTVIITTTIKQHNFAIINSSLSFIIDIANRIPSVIEINNVVDVWNALTPGSPTDFCRGFHLHSKNIYPKSGDTPRGSVWIRLHCSNLTPWHQVKP